MTEVEAEEAIYQRFDTGWTALHPASQSDAQHVPFTFRNETFAPSQLGALGAYVSVSIQHSTREQTTQGSPSKEHVRGNVIVRLFGPLNEGTKKLAGLADDVRTVLAKKNLNGLNLYS